MSGILDQLHFMRPLFLLLAIPAVILVILLLRRQYNKNAWQQFIEPALLLPLLHGKINRPSTALPLIASLFWFISVVALAGPTWQKIPQPVEKRNSALVVLFDLSPSMLAQDIKPSRLVAARHKIIDLLQLRKEGYSALIGYSGDAHVVTPLTDDTKTIVNLVKVLEPGIMPVYGSNLEHAIELALELFKNAGYTSGDILLVTDGITQQALDKSVMLLAQKSFRLSIVGVGTEAGAPIPAATGGFVKNADGSIVLPQLHTDKLLELAKKVNGNYSPLQLDDTDIKSLADSSLFIEQDMEKEERQFDQWRDMGVFLSPILLILFLPVFRRGFAMLFFAILVSSASPKTFAADSGKTDSFWPEWNSLWLNKNQLGMKAMEKGNYEEAVKNFTDPDWKASAEYENGNYKSALDHFKNDNTANGFYNQGNALAKSGQFEHAINAYNDALKLQPRFDDAITNKKIIEEILRNADKDKDKDKQKQNPEDMSEPDKDAREQASDANNQQQQENADKSNNGPAKNSPEQGDNSIDKEMAREENDAENPAVESSDEQKKPTQGAPKLTPEQQQALDQWLRKVPDDPSGLLRNKFSYYHQQRLQKQEKTSHMNSEERW